MITRFIAIRTVLFATTVGFVTLPFPAPAQDAKPVAGISFPGSGESSAPMNLIDQGDIVVAMMRDAGVDDAAVEAMEAFQDFVSKNGDLVKKPISEMSQEERKKLQAGYKGALTGMAVIKPLADVLASREWLTRADPALAARLKERCGRTFVSGRDVVKEFGELSANPTKFAGDTINIFEDFTGIHRECAESAADFAALSAQESKRLAAFMESEDRLLQQAIANGDQEAIDRHKANLEQARQDKKDVDRDFNWAQALKFLSGLGQTIGGVVAIIATAGSCVPCYAAVANGVYEGYTAIDAMTGPDSVVVTSPASRPGIDPAATVTTADFANAVTEIDADPLYTIIQPKTPGGNFIVTRKAGTSLLVIHQIKPEPFIIELDLTNVKSGTGSNEALLPLNKLTDVIWTEVEGTEGIQPTRVNLMMMGTLGGVDVKVSFNENPVGDPMVVIATAK